MQQQKHFSSDIMKNHSNVVSQKENDNFIVLKPKDIDYYDLTDKEFKNVKKFTKLRENSGRQWNDLRNKIKEQKEYFTKEIEILQKNQTNSGVEEFNKGNE